MCPEASQCPTWFQSQFIHLFSIMKEIYFLLFKSYLLLIYMYIVMYMCVYNVYISSSIQILLNNILLINIKVILITMVSVHI